MSILNIVSTFRTSKGKLAMSLTSTPTVDAVALPIASDNLDHFLANSPTRGALITDPETAPLSLTWARMGDALVKDEELLGDQVLSTKLFVPVASHDLIPRPRLMALLNASPRRPLTLVSAPAGFGKT